jgi:hypothetical protein
VRRPGGQFSAGLETIAEREAETRAEKLGSSLGVMSAIFYFLPFVITI